MHINVLRHFFFFASANDVAAFSDDGSIGKKKSSKKSKYFCMHIRHAHKCIMHFLPTCAFWEQKYLFLSISSAFHIFFVSFWEISFSLSIHGKWFRLLCMQKAAAAAEASTTSRSSYSINEKTERKKKHSKNTRNNLSHISSCAKLIKIHFPSEDMQQTCTQIEWN